MWFWAATGFGVVSIAMFAFNRELVPSTRKRFLIYLLGVPVLAVILASLIVALDPCDSADGDCDLAGLAAFWLAVFVVAVGFGSALVFESLRALLGASRSRALVAILIVASVSLVVAGLAYWTVNPTLTNTSRPDWGYNADYECLAPWDVVLNDANNSRGGEPRPDQDRMVERCDEVTNARFDRGTPFLGAGASLSVALAGGAVIARGRGRRARPLTGSRTRP